mmetsp:Transcript_96747/g.276257  ORF Transcript_96747/g.276257 Transcript_96747/m.276257 type:complete len:158 (+) Transcript_96747:742-1215(+)
MFWPIALPHPTRPDPNRPEPTQPNKQHNQLTRSPPPPSLSFSISHLATDLQRRAGAGGTTHSPPCLRTHGHVPHATMAAAEPAKEQIYVHGYLYKKTRDGRWQKRWFETNGCFLTYYKNKKMTKLLAALNLPQVGEITLLPPDHPDDVDKVRRTRLS